jgi:hypothetical protein
LTIMTMTRICEYSLPSSGFAGVIFLYITSALP